MTSSDSSEKMAHITNYTTLLIIPCFQAKSRLFSIPNYTSIQSLLKFVLTSCKHLLSIVSHN